MNVYSDDNKERLMLARTGHASKAAAQSGYFHARTSVKKWHSLQSELGGINPTLRAILNDRTVTDVFIHGDKELWIDRGKGIEKTDFPFEEDIRTIATRLSAACGKRLDDASPIVDGMLPEGIRVHAILPPLAVGAPIISLRIQQQSPFSLDELLRRKMVTQRMRELLETMIQARLSIFVCGATGSGKTTLLGALLATVAPTQRIICIEEVNELQITHPHVVYLQERQANVQGKGSVSMSELLRAAMRMRPDRIVLGECRGSEVREVLSALNTGHEGSCATVHANTAGDVPARLCALGALAGMDEKAVYAQAGAGIDAVVHVRRQMIGSRLYRWVQEVAIPRYQHGALVITTALRCHHDGSIEHMPAFEQLQEILRERGCHLADPATPDMIKPLDSQNVALSGPRKVSSSYVSPQSTGCTPILRKGVDT